MVPTLRFAANPGQIVFDRHSLKMARHFNLDFDAWILAGALLGRRKHGNCGTYTEFGGCLGLSNVFYHHSEVCCGVDKLSSFYGASCSRQDA
jgi:hypothetical protein